MPCEGDAWFTGTVSYRDSAPGRSQLVKTCQTKVTASGTAPLVAEAGTKGREEESAVITWRDRCRKSYSSAVPVSRLSTQVPAYVDETEHLNCGAFCGEYHSKKSERQTHTMKGTHLTAQGYPRDRIPDCQNADDSAYLDRLCSQLSTPAKCADVLAPRSSSNSWSGPPGYAKKQLPTEDPT